MTLAPMYVIFCDGPGCGSATAAWPTRRAALAAAKAAGWAATATGHWCPADVAGRAPLWTIGDPG